ncbi:hypothetical protein CPU12_00085 [Malaciobacter molluscorum LMG 25693]|uniref:Alpha/beta hydrolase family protein n=1 Tax=Malaciobacter molluscorum LMG 25693 TaxID=870501 RepID=A0A2G1DL19_9BACT|nr:alpha/beta hydrolase [Malaciobacter molluscorum]AXX91982.1 alpha/beta hydrolase family protein [Malaciobacter molluscorum LMG 25693]PHO19215.1 hypothetical protein CPU12_00085 [Malaciobacter molluscorum LMG 25693]
MTKKRVYLITGFMCDERVWNKVETLLHDSYEFIHISIPNENSFEKIVKKINIEDENINLIGFSLGGYIASYYALKNYLKINKVLVISSTLCSLNDDEIRQREFALELVKEYGFSILNDKKIKTLIENKNDNSLIALIKDMYKNNGKEKFINLLQSTTYRKDLSNMLQKSNTDFNFLYSEDDILLDKNWIDTIKENTNFLFESIPSDTHMIPLEKSDILETKIRQLF